MTSHLGPVFGDVSRGLRSLRRSGDLRFPRRHARHGAAGYSASREPLDIHARCRRRHVQVTRAPSYHVPPSTVIPTPHVSYTSLPETGPRQPTGSTPRRSRKRHGERDDSTARRINDYIDSDQARHGELADLQSDRRDFAASTGNEAGTDLNDTGVEDWRWRDRDLPAVTDLRGHTPRCDHRHLPIAGAQVVRRRWCRCGSSTTTTPATQPGPHRSRSHNGRGGDGFNDQVEFDFGMYNDRTATTDDDDRIVVEVVHGSRTSRQRRRHSTWSTPPSSTSGSAWSTPPTSR